MGSYDKTSYRILKWGPWYYYSNIIVAARLTCPKQDLQKSHKWSLTLSYIHQFIKDGQKNCMIMIWGLWSVGKAATKGHLLLYLVIHLLPPRELDGREFITGLVPMLSVKRLPSLTTSKTQPPQGTRQPGMESLQLRKYQTNPTW